MICIRIFDTREEAELAKKVLEEGGILSVVSEDKFEDVPIQNYGVPARYRLKVDEADYYKTARFLAGKLKNRKD